MGAAKPALKFGLSSSGFVGVQPEATSPPDFARATDAAGAVTKYESIVEETKMIFEAAYASWSPLYDVPSRC
ncbi:hypothetical protein [Candidatus Accumulibacter sp. ACC007]|uniref:hypothetical protein n=1 Tax=Candidatus Accumulibacter sp. ACC007 TaxID=2823333 RepID=UPI0025BBD332|nr:hypothetical protein [Candidatus Accumulibacter sp. ACC007]